MELEIVKNLEQFFTLNASQVIIVLDVVFANQSLLNAELSVYKTVWIYHAPRK